MMTPGQIWVTRRLSDIIDLVEEAAGDISTDDYPNFDSWVMDVFDSALNRLGNEDYTNETQFLDKYSSIISSLEDIFKEQLYDFYLSEKNEIIKEDINLRILRRGGDIQKIRDIIDYQTEIQDPCDFEDGEDFADFCIGQGFHFYYCDEGYCDEDEEDEDYEGPSEQMVEIRDEVEIFLTEEYEDELIEFWNKSKC